MNFTTKGFQFFLIIYLMNYATGVYAQDRLLELYQRSFYFDSTELIGSSDESSAELGDSLAYPFTFGMKNLVFHEGLFYHAFAQLNNSWDVYLRTSPDGINWSEKVRVDDDTSDTHQYYVGVTVTGSGTDTRIIIRWTDLRGPHPQLRCAVSTDGGNSFSPSIEISNHTDSDYLDGSITADAEGNLYAAWFRRTPGNAYFNTYFSKSTDGGFTWTDQEIIHTGRIFSYPAQIVASDDGKVMVVICDDQNNRTNLVVRYSPDGGATWQTRSQITDYSFGEGAQAWFSLGIGADNSIYAIYEYGRNNTADNNILISKTIDWGDTWSEITPVSDPVQIFPIHEWHADGNPSIAISPGGNVYAVWADQRYDLTNKIWNVYLSYSTDGGETWSEDLLVNGSNETEFQYRPSITVKSDGTIDTVLVIWNDRRTVVTNVEQERHTPSGYYLAQNYPNPFNPSTTIRYAIASRQFVSLKVYDVLGREVAMLVYEEQEPGAYEVEFSSRSGFQSGKSVYSLTSGTYFYTLRAGDFTETKKLLLVK